MENREFKAVNLKYEYPGMVGEAVWAIVSDMSQEELQKQYGRELSGFCPYVVLTLEQGEALQEFHRNEQKHRMRQVRSYDSFAYEEGVTELFHGELVLDDLFEKLTQKEERERIRAALEKLTPVQKRRVVQYFFGGLSEREIAALEGVNRRAVADSLAGALKKLKNYL